MNRYTLSFAPAARNDFDRIVLHLISSYEAFGDTQIEAFLKADERMDAVGKFIQTLKELPHRGTVRNDLQRDLRVLSDGKGATLAFRINEDTINIHVLRIFYGGEDMDIILKN